MSDISSFLNFTSSTAIEVGATLFAIGGASYMGSVDNNKRLASYALFSVSNFLLFKVALDNNMLALMGQVGVLSYMSFRGAKNTIENAMKDEETTGKSTFVSRIFSVKNKAIKAGLNRVSNIWNDIEQEIKNVTDVIKSNKEGSLLFVTASLMPLINMNPDIGITIMDTVKHLVNTPNETLAAGLALYGTYLMSNKDLETRIKGLGNFLAADMLYVGIAYDKELYPLLAQSVVFLGTTLKAFNDLDVGLKEEGTSSFEILKKDIYKSMEILKLKKPELSSETINLRN